MSRLFFFCLFVLSTGYSLPLLYTSGSSKITFFRTDPATALSPYNKEKLGKRAQMHTSGERAFSGLFRSISSLKNRSHNFLFISDHAVVIFHFSFVRISDLRATKRSSSCVKNKKKIFKVIDFPYYYGFCFMSRYRIQLQSLVQQVSLCKLCL